MLSFVVAYMAACSSERQQPAGLFNIDSVITIQVRNLLAQKATIRKTARLNGLEKTSSITPSDTVGWEQELSIFLGLDVLNKPINKGEYKVETSTDPESGLLVKSFSTTEDLPVKFLRVYYDLTPSDIRRIEAKYDETNSLYASTRLLTLNFSGESNLRLLSSYQIVGGQKMFLDDSVEYNISAVIDLKK
jgi:hypothetical protein